MNLSLKHAVAGAILVMAGFGAYSAEEPNAAPATAKPASKTVIRKTETLSSPTSVPAASDKVKPISKKAVNNILKAQSLTAKDIIAKMAANYKKCSSYLDSGMVNTTFFMKKGPYVDKVPFSTAFKRPGQFRFAFSLKPPKKGAKIKHHIILVKDKKIFVWQDPAVGVEEEESFKDAIADAVGTSGGAAQTIPVLIGANQVGGRSIAEIFNKKRLQDAVQDGIMCFRIQGQRTKTEPGLVTLWISQKTFLIRRIDSSHEFSNFRTETSKIYHPQINVPVAADKLELNIPK